MNYSVTIVNYGFCLRRTILPELDLEENNNCQIGVPEKNSSGSLWELRLKINHSIALAKFGNLALCAGFLLNNYYRINQWFGILSYYHRIFKLNWLYKEILSRRGLWLGYLKRRYLDWDMAGIKYIHLKLNFIRPYRTFSWKLTYNFASGNTSCLQLFFTFCPK